MLGRYSYWTVLEERSGDKRISEKVASKRRTFCSCNHSLVMQSDTPDNANPTVYSTQNKRRSKAKRQQYTIEFDDDDKWLQPVADITAHSDRSDSSSDEQQIDSEEIFGALRPFARSSR